MILNQQVAKATIKEIDRLAKKYNLPTEVVNSIVRSQFKFLGDVIEDPDDNTTIIVRYLGKFMIKDSFIYGKKYGKYGQHMLQVSE